MIAFIVTAFTWIFANFKLFLYAVGGIVLALLIWKAYSIISENAADKILIQQYKQNEIVYQQQIKNQQDTIKLETDLANLNDQTVQDKEAVISDLNAKYDSLVQSSLGQDLDSPASASLKELVTQLKAKGL